MTPDEPIAERDRLLAEANERNAALVRMLERQGFQLDRMQDQLEKALREIAALRRQLNKPPPEDPSPAPLAPAPEGTQDAAGTLAPPAPLPSRTKPPRRKRERFGRNKLPSALDRVTDPAATDACPRCGGTDTVVLRRDTHEVYDYVPAQLVARVVDRPLGHCRTCNTLVQPPLPADLIPKLLATPELLAHIIYEKFGRHLPLNRIDVELRRLGGDIREVTRDRWLRWSARHLDLLLPALKTELFIERMLHTDGTGYPVLQTGTKVRLGQIAVFCNARAVIYDYTPSKHTWVETCRLHGVDPPTWLADVLPRIATTRPSEYADLLPGRWAALRRMKVAA